MKELVKKRFDQIKELSHEINHDDLAYYFKGNTAIERFDDFNNGKDFLQKHNLVELSYKKRKNCRMYLTQI